MRPDGNNCRPAPRECTDSPGGCDPACDGGAVRHVVFHWPPHPGDEPQHRLVAYWRAYDRAHGAYMAALERATSPRKERLEAAWDAMRLGYALEDAFLRYHASAEAAAPFVCGGREEAPLTGERTDYAALGFGLVLAV
jgi:hypothetical protein